MFGEDGVPVSFVYVTDLARATAFYRDTLQLKPRDPDEYGLFFETAGALIRMTAIPDHQAGPHPVLGWNVAHVPTAVAALADRGVACAIYEGMGQDAQGVWTSPDGAQLAWFADPDGNVLMLSST